MRKCFELIGGGHCKFWTCEVVGNHYLATFGRIGTDGQTQVKSFGNHHQALDKAEAMIHEKTRKGYVQVGANAHPGAMRQLLNSLAKEPEAKSAPREEPAHQPGGRRIVPLA